MIAFIAIIRQGRQQCALSETTKGKSNQFYVQNGSLPRGAAPGEGGVQHVQSFLSNICSSLDGKQMALVDWHQVAVIHHHLRCSILHRD